MRVGELALVESEARGAGRVTINQVLQVPVLTPRSPPTLTPDASGHPAPLGRRIALPALVLLRSASPGPTAASQWGRGA